MMEKSQCFRIIDRASRAMTSEPRETMIKSELVKLMLNRFPEIYEKSQSFLSRYDPVRDKFREVGVAEHEAMDVSKRVSLNLLRREGAGAGKLDRDTVLELLQVR